MIAKIISDSVNSLLQPTAHTNIHTMEKQITTKMKKSVLSQKSLMMACPIIIKALEYIMCQKISFTQSITVDAVNLHCLLFVAQLIL